MLPWEQPNSIRRSRRNISMDNPPPLQSKNRQQYSIATSTTSTVRTTREEAESTPSSNALLQPVATSSKPSETEPIALNTVVSAPHASNGSAGAISRRNTIASTNLVLSQTHGGRLGATSMMESSHRAESTLQDQLAEKDREIISLRNTLTEKDAEVVRLKETVFSALCRLSAF